MSMSDEDRIRRAEGIKAHAKLRDEVRLAVRDEFLKAGLSKEEIKTLISETIKEEVTKRTSGYEISVAEYVAEYIARAVKAEFDRHAGGKSIKNAIDKAIEEQAAELARKFVSRNITVRINEGSW